MSRKKKTAYVRKAWETKMPGADTKEPFVALYASMLGSNAWHALSDRQKILYIAMRSQYGNGKGDLKDGQFYFNRSIWKESLKLYTNETRFYKDRDELVDHGFIDIVENGRTTRTKSIYAYSDRWKQYKVPP